MDKPWDTFDPIPKTQTPTKKKKMTQTRISKLQRLILKYIAGQNKPPLTDQIKLHTYAYYTRGQNKQTRIITKRGTHTIIRDKDHYNNFQRTFRRSLKNLESQGLVKHTIPWFKWRIRPKGRNTLARKT